jgi:hypothetical protein
LAAINVPPRPNAEVKGRPAEQVVHNSRQFRRLQWQVVRLARQSLADQVWRVKAAQVWLHGAAGWSQRTYWLIWASNDETGEEKFFLSNAPAEARLEVLVRVGFRRWNVEHALRVGKSELGFTHFEGRRYVALMRHLSLCLLSLTFVAEQTDRLREKNPDVTMEQVCRALGAICRDWLRRVRQTTDLECTLSTIEYHQARNRQATTAKKRRAVIVRNRKKPRPRRKKPKSRSTVRSK